MDSHQHEHSHHQLHIIIFAAKRDNGLLLEKFKWQEVEVEEEEVAVGVGRLPQNMCAVPLRITFVRGMQAKDGGAAFAAVLFCTHACRRRMYFTFAVCVPRYEPFHYLVRVVKKQTENDRPTGRLNGWWIGGRGGIGRRIAGGVRVNGLNTLRE